MKVLHLSSEKTWRGGEQQIAYLIEEHIKKGITTWVACRRGTAFETYCKRKEIPHIALRFANQFDFITAWQIRSFCKKEKIDIMHLHSGKSHGIGVLAHMLGAGCKLILSKRTAFVIRKNAANQFKYNYRGIHQIICIAKVIQKKVNEILNDEAKSTTIYSGIDLHKFPSKTSENILREKYTIPKSKVLVGIVAALTPEKDHITFLNVAAQLIKEGVEAHFIIIGDGKGREEIEAHLTKLALQEYVTLTGFLENVPLVLPELDIFLMTSTQEGLGTSLLDAIACKVPVVATKTGGVPEIIIHEQTGLIAPPKEVTQLSQHVLRLIQEPTLREKLVNQAYKHLLTHFKKEKTAEETLTVYQEVLGEE